MSGATTQHLSLNKITLDNQIRSGELDEQELIGLAITIREVGQLVPILVRPAGDKYMIVDGHRRYMAMLKLKRDSIEAIVDRELSEGEALHRQWISNCQRSEIVQIDRARSIQRIIELTGWSPTKTAKRLGVTAAAVSRSLSMLKLPEPIIAKVEEGRLAPSTAAELVKIDNPATQAALAEAAVNGELTRDAVSAEVRRQKNRQKKSEKTPSQLKRATIQLADGDSVTVTGESLTLERIVDVLEEARSKAKKAWSRGLEARAWLRMAREDATANSKTAGGQPAKSAWDAVGPPLLSQEM